MAVKLLKKDPNVFVYRVALILPLFSSTLHISSPLVYKSIIPTLFFGVPPPLNHDLSGRAGTLVTGTSLWDVSGEPAMGSVMDLGTRAGDRTLKSSPLSDDWNFVTCMFPNLSTWHSQTMMKPTFSHLTHCLTANFTCKKYTPVLL